MKDPPDPTPWIRAIIWAGFISGNVAGAVYLALAHENLFAIDVLTLFGGFLLLGLLGMLAGMIVGLSSLRLLEAMGQVGRAGWVCVVLSTCTSALSGLAVTHAIMSWLEAI